MFDLRLMETANVGGGLGDEFPVLRIHARCGAYDLFSVQTERRLQSRTIKAPAVLKEGFIPAQGDVGKDVPHPLLDGFFGTGAPFEQTRKPGPIVFGTYL